MYNSLAQEIVWFACAKIGAVYAALNVSLARNDLAYSLNDTGAKLLIADDELMEVCEAASDRFSSPPKVLVHGAPRAGYGAWEELLTGSEALPVAEVRPTDPAAIVYTGGSTSMPKGVLVSHLYYIGAAIRYAESRRGRSRRRAFCELAFLPISAASNSASPVRSIPA